jgi:hypothetical protein
MTRIELTDEQEKVLSQVLQNSLATLQIELLHTDHQEFKEFLKRRLQVLQGLAASLARPVSAAA